MRISIMPSTTNVGREDRLVRGGVALSLALLGTFALVISGHVGVTSVLFGALLGYFALTGGVGWDPLYARAGIDTRTDAEVGIEADLATWPEPTAAAVGSDDHAAGQVRGS